MRTQVKKNGEMVVVTMEGRLDFETNEPLRADLKKLLKTELAAATAKTDSVPSKIIFNLENLEFVGSSGITPFIETLKDFNNVAPTKPRYCNVKSEFKRMIKAFDEADTFDIYDNEERAKRSFDVNN